jgi:hypothetical protein
MIKFDGIISAGEAHKAVIDMCRDARDLADDAVNQILEDLNYKVKNAIQFAEFEAQVTLAPINRLNAINIKAAKDCVALLAHSLNQLRYDHSSFTNHTPSITVRWLNL